METSSDTMFAQGTERPLSICGTSVAELAKSYDPLVPFMPVTLPLPSLYVTRPMRDGNREYVITYDDSIDDPDGELALELGARYYDEGMSYQDGSDRQKQVDCFQAAEILYLHAAARENEVAFECLGYVYYYDRCKGEYWEHRLAQHLPEGSPAPGGNCTGYGCETIPYHENRAYECFQRAASEGSGQAMYKLGDLLMRWDNGDPDRIAGFMWYEKAYAASWNMHPVVWGSAALRLAKCYEEGKGCGLSLEKACNYYQIAVAGLEAAVEAGEFWFEASLASARRGLARIEQELGE